MAPTPRHAYSKQELLEAIRVVKDGEMSISMASRVFKIPYATLGDKLRGRRPIDIQPRTLLLSEEEKRLVIWIKESAENGLGKSGNEVRNAVKEFLDARDAKTNSRDNRPSRQWLNDFLKRHPGLALCRSSSSHKKQALMSEGSSCIASWSSDLKDHNIGDIDVKDHNIGDINSSIDMSEDVSPEVLYNSNDSDSDSSYCPSDDESITPKGSKHVDILSSKTARAYHLSDPIARNNQVSSPSPSTVSTNQLSNRSFRNNESSASTTNTSELRALAPSTCQASASPVPYENIKKLLEFTALAGPHKLKRLWTSYFDGISDTALLHLNRNKFCHLLDNVIKPSSTAPLPPESERSNADPISALPQFPQNKTNEKQTPEKSTPISVTLSGTEFKIYLTMNGKEKEVSINSKKTRKVDREESRKRKMALAEKEEKRKKSRTSKDQKKSTKKKITHESS